MMTVYTLPFLPDTLATAAGMWIVPFRPMVTFGVGSCVDHLATNFPTLVDTVGAPTMRGTGDVVLTVSFLRYSISAPQTPPVP